ncbi:DNA topoisomerase 3 [Lachnospiraceae bacterium]|jgi:Topoisomerase IA|nr:DNA topoisomerase 3 [Lachnospiraceae bacterium]
MKKVLIVAEKPQAGKDIAKILGVTGEHKGYMESDQYIVTWALGHLISLKHPDEADERFKKWKLEDLPLITDNGLKVNSKTSSQFKVIKELVGREDVCKIINAGDAGREGLLIQSWIYRMAGNKHPVDILWASSLTDEAIKKALNNLHSDREPEFINLLREAEARAEGDLKYGFNYSRMLTLLYAEPGTVLSYGRCQTPLLNLICARDMEYENFKPEPYWTVEAVYSKGFKGSLANPETGQPLHMTDKKEAQAVIQECSGMKCQVLQYINEEKSDKAPALYNLSELQGAMGKRYGFTPDKTLQIAQSLYETHKILSYPRTDSRYLSDDLYHEIGEHLKACDFGKFSPVMADIPLLELKKDKAYFNNNKVSDHHALIPTTNPDMAAIYQKLTEDERNCFDLIIASLAAIFLPPYQYTSTKIITEASGRQFHSSGTIIRNLGYKKVHAILGGTSNKEGGEGKQLQILPELSEGELLSTDNFKLIKGMTKPPARYTPGNIIKLMNKHSIGTSATAAEIVKTLERRGFIILEKNKYLSTSLGREFISVVPEELKSPALTREFEEELKKVNSGELTKEEFLCKIDEGVAGNLKKFSASKVGKKMGAGKKAVKCPICSSPVRSGKTQSGKENWYCTGYKNTPPCPFKIWKTIAGKKITDQQAGDLITKGKTSLIKGFKSSSGKEFSAYLVLNEAGQTEFKFKERKR